jgi:hypothetical protein
LEDILKNNAGISQLQTAPHWLKLRFAKLKPVRGSFTVGLH